MGRQLDRMDTANRPITGTDAFDMNPDVPRLDLTTQLGQRLVGQPEAIAAVVPYVQIYDAGLSPMGRPAGVFLLLGPTGTGKTRTVEALAEVLHGSAKHLLRIDCAEFQEDHEIAKLLGAPPGYVGHRESQPILTQQKLQQVTSENSKLSLILFDEIEKAAPSLSTLLLGVLDKATLRLGDGSTINFENSLIFMTSNLGARAMMRELQPDIGFRSAVEADPGDLKRRLESIGVTAVRKRFSPEFVNRLDAIVTYMPLDENAMAAILEDQFEDLQRHLDTRLAHCSFELLATPAARQFLLARGVSPQCGARELKRTMHRHLSQPLAVRVTNGEIPPGALVTVDVSDTGTELMFGVTATSCPRPAPRTVLVVDDNQALVGWLAAYLAGEGCRVLRASTLREAEACLASHEVAAAFIDQTLPDGDGVQFATRLASRTPRVMSIVMSGGTLSEADQIVCRRFALPVLTKPFPGPQMLSFLEEFANDGRDRAQTAR